MNKVIVAGTRTFNDYDLLKYKLDIYLSNLSDICIVSGGSRGADHLGEIYSKERGYNLEVYPADWSLGKKAGYIRNEEMAKIAQYLVVFWDGKSRGTYNMIELAKKYKLKIKMVRY